MFCHSFHFTYNVHVFMKPFTSQTRTAHLSVPFIAINSAVLKKIAIMMSEEHISNDMGKSSKKSKVPSLISIYPVPFHFNSSEKGN